VKILAVFAHPDDETFGPGGTLARSASEGHPVKLVSMTRGDAGTLGPAKHLSPQELGKLRSRELENAARELGIREISIHDLPDGRLKNLPDATGVAVIEKEMRGFSPDILITFHREGISAHPDHIRVTEWCLMAVRHFRRKIRLLQFGPTKEQAALITHRKIVPAPDREITHCLDVHSFIPQKLAAARCHASQAELFQQFLNLGEKLKDFWQTECFVQAWPQMAKPEKPYITLKETNNV